MKIFQQGIVKQILGQTMSHVFIVLIGTVFGLGAMWWILDKPVWEAVFSVFFTLFYFSIVYRKAWDYASHDKKPYVEMTPYKAKGAVLSIGILLLNLILWIAYKFSWTFMTIDGSLATYTGVFYNVAYIFNTFMYVGFINLSNGSMNWYGHIIIYAVPLAASTLGYIAGLKDFTLSDKLMPFIYEKKKK